MVASVRYRSGAVEGVRLTTGDVVDAPLVICAIAPDHLGYEAVTRSTKRVSEWTSSWRQRPHPDGYESKLDAVVSEPPRLRGVNYEETGSEQGALAASGVVAPSPPGIAEAHAAYRSGRVGESPLLYFNIPSILDPEMRPAGGDHLLSLEVLFTPYALAGGWDGSREPDRWLEKFADRAEPGFLDSVRSYTVMTPPKYERDLFLARGHVPSFPGGPIAALLGRKDRSLSRHATPLRGLFLSGGATFPGAGVWGASGRNAAAVALKQAAG